MCLTYACLFLLSFLAISYGQCPFNETSLRIENGYMSNAANINITITVLGKLIAYGYLTYSCAPGYTTNPTIGSRLTCNTNGSWSALPVCQPVAPCPIAPLFTFLQDRSVTMTFNGTYSLPRVRADNSDVTSGAFVSMICKNGYVNIAGPFNITCVNGSWTPFPACILNSHGVPVTSTTTTMKPNCGSPCHVDSASFSIENGFIVRNTPPILPLDTTFSGWILFSCAPGYMIDPAIGRLYTCNDGVWSTKPRCLRTDNCSLSTLNTLLSTTTGLQTTGQAQLIQKPYEPTLVVNGSYIVFSCMIGYTNIGGSLNMTCLNSSWTSFPYCISGTQMRRG